MMRIRTLIWGALMVAGCWLSTGAGWAGRPPLPVPATGGLPKCEAELAACTATAQAFPATGQTTCWDCFPDLHISSTTYTPDTISLWDVGFLRGDSTDAGKDSNGEHVCAVRGGL